MQTTLSKVNVKRVFSRFLIAKLIILASPLFAVEVFSQELPRIPQFDNDEVNITLDGFVDESIWESIPIVDDMKISDPDTLEDAPYRTDIRFFYTETGIFFSMVILASEAFSFFENAPN